MLDNGSVLVWGKYFYNKTYNPPVNRTFVDISAGDKLIGLLDNGELLSIDVDTGKYRKVTDKKVKVV